MYSIIYYITEFIIRLGFKSIQIIQVTGVGNSVGPTCVGVMCTTYDHVNTVPALCRFFYNLYPLNYCLFITPGVLKTQKTTCITPNT